jgi:hypothetical protein
MKGSTMNWQFCDWVFDFFKTFENCGYITEPGL